MLSVYMCSQPSEIVVALLTLAVASFNAPVKYAPVALSSVYLVDVNLPNDVLGLIDAKPTLTMLSPAFCANAPELQPMQHMPRQFLK
jgi:hypothetical protein